MIFELQRSLKVQKTYGQSRKPCHESDESDSDMMFESNQFNIDTRCAGKDGKIMKSLIIIIIIIIITTVRM
jgi:hypothetical protein